MTSRQASQRCRLQARRQRCVRKQAGLQSAKVALACGFDFPPTSRIYQSRLFWAVEPRWVQRQNVRAFYARRKRGLPRASPQRGCSGVRLRRQRLASFQVLTQTTCVRT